MISQRQLFLQHVGQTSDFPLQLEIERAEGIYMYDIHDKEYIDLTSGVSVSNVGHRHPQVVDAIKKQVDKYLHLMVYGEYIQSPQVAYASKLTSLLPESLSSVYFVNSGSEAIEGALKLAKRFTGRSEIIAFKNAYHGSTHGSLSVMGNEMFKNSFRPLLPDIRFLEFNNFSDIEKISSKTACVLVEPVQGEAGIIIPGLNFLDKLRKKCSETKTILIFDEIQTGFGRTGELFAFMKYGVTPDILTVAKGMGGGMPLGAFISSNRIMGSLKTNPILGHITTFGGHPVSCAAAIASLDVILNEKLIQSIPAKENLFRKLLKHKEIKEIRGTGLFLAVELENFKQVKKVIDIAITKGLVTDWFLFHDRAFRISPPLTISNSQIEKACSILIDSIDESIK
ncbi:MAG: aminotransferase class III [Bacteroidetes bacterium GWC2_33_15]|nr:MAG: aminotransferase class III [Bacteroidetes bacterium GWA2_33_15]OFX51082.1 MAG: aminotransferase class III [Bacteroidetes bacterium GWC2_33_15]OFX66485.1 MAG: aminotransferase class III [Bacteroidetes bacterium GWB2_32_14]OFX70290.1 MAG: aminotransferase class III [Bacteroidetes bacterium GWD2_33_33]HAN17287.1 aspartate aminotransferase family protein [Bacteroidales bacterium]